MFIPLNGFRFPMTDADENLLIFRNSLEEKAPYLEREEAERKIYRVKMDSWKNDQKLLNSLKTPNERKRNFDIVNDADQREDTDSGLGQKYGEAEIRCTCHETDLFPLTWSNNVISCRDYFV